MNFIEYQKLCVVTKKPWAAQEGELADCGLGIAGEAGEVADIIKKHLSGSKPLDAEGLRDLQYELGDVMWYIASLCDCLGFDMSKVAELNIAKLRKRHGESFSGYGKRGGH